MDQLLDDAIAGSRAARDELMRRFAGEVRAHVQRAMGGRMRRYFSVDDLTQEVFLKVFQSLHTLEPGSGAVAFQARLFRTAQWVVTGRGQRALGFVGESAAGGEEPAAPRRATGAVTLEDEVAWFRRLAERLDPKYGRVMLLRSEGKSFEEIAHAMGEQEATVRKRYTRAYAMLKRTIDGRNEAES